MESSRNNLILAVAGSRKTQGIVDACATSSRAERTLILTYTSANQHELRHRLSTVAGNRARIEVAGWFSFLIRNFARPFLPFMFHGKRVGGFDFKSPPQQGTSVTAWRRYFNQQDEVRKVHLPQLAVRLEEASSGAGIRRLEKLYDRIYIDEVQDLSGYDLEVLRLLMGSGIRLEMVGDIRQAILSTNSREQKNKKYQYMRIWDWFNEQERIGLLEIEQRSETWRCSPEVAALADSLFGDEWGFDPTVSLNAKATSHDGIHLVRTGHIDAYVDRFDPLLLRHSVSSAKDHSHLPFMNFGLSKGLGRERVLIYPTEPIKRFIREGRALTPSQAAPFYVAITRAEQSVALVVDDPGRSSFPYWAPVDPTS